MENLLSRLNFRHLRLVNAIAGTGQLSLAAEQLSITQPAASRSLGDIERMVGDDLFERHPSGMTPTATGAVLVRHAAALIGQFEQAVEEVDGFRNGRTGTVRVGAVTGSAVRYVVPAIQKLKAEASRETTVVADVAPSVELLAGLSAGEYDMVLCRLPGDGATSDFDIQRGRVEVLRMVTRAGHPLHKKSNVSFSDLQHLTWVVQGPGMPIRGALVQAFANRHLAPPEDTVDTASLVMALSYLENSDAVAAMTEESAALVAPSDGQWRVLPMREEVIMTPYSLVMRKNAVISPLCARFHALLRAELAPG